MNSARVSLLSSAPRRAATLVEAGFAATNFRRAKILLAAFAIGFGALLPSPEARAANFVLADATLADIAAAQKAGALSSEKLVQLYLARIAAYEKQGPSLNTIITLNPNALAEAKALDIERKKKGPRSALHGVPVILKDNYDTFDLPNHRRLRISRWFDSSTGQFRHRASPRRWRDHPRQSQHQRVRPQRQSQWL